MIEKGKAPSDQVKEIEKLVFDAREKLDQVDRALRTLRDRLEAHEPSGDDGGGD